MSNDDVGGGSTKSVLVEQRKVSCALSGVLMIVDAGAMCCLRLCPIVEDERDEWQREGK